MSWGEYVVLMIVGVLMYAVPIASVAAMCYWLYTVIVN